MAVIDDARLVRYDWRRIRLGLPTGIQAELGGLLTPVSPKGLSLDDWGAGLMPAAWNGALRQGLYAHGPQVPDGQVLAVPVHRFHPLDEGTVRASVAALLHHTTPDAAVWWWLPVPRADLSAAVRASLDAMADGHWTEPLRWDVRALRFTAPTYAPGCIAFVVPSLWMASYAITRNAADRRRMVADLAALAEEAATEHTLVLADTTEAPDQIPLWAALAHTVRVGWLDEAEPAADLGSAPAGA
ncbi:MAG: hypothetical protein ACP5QO_07510 [Clostridia bacterium]